MFGRDHHELVLDGCPPCPNGWDTDDAMYFAGPDFEEAPAFHNLKDLAIKLEGSCLFKGAKTSIAGVKKCKLVLSMQPSRTIC